MFLSAYITLPGYHVTFLWHHWDHWDNLSSPSSNLIEPCWHTVISCVFGKICGPNLRCHEFGPGLLMANSYGQFTFSCSVSNIIKSEPSCTSYTVSVLDFGTFFCNNSSISQPNLMFNTDTAFFLHLSVDSDMHLNFENPCRHSNFRDILRRGVQEKKCF